MMAIKSLAFSSLLSALIACAWAWPAGAQEEIPKHFFVAPPPFSEGIFPCSQCHKDMPVNTKPRKLEQMHDNIQLRHMPNGWCFECHTPRDRDVLHLANGSTVKFEESYNLCGQCHGTVLRDWKVGLHGKRTGSWNGDKQYLLCVNCHSPHDPVFKPLQPLPPPLAPSEIK